ncbi:MAG TPA: hypothetical protein VGM88_30990 [Kofleriaceae bacterium]
MTRALVALGAVAAILAAVLAIDLLHARAPASRLLVPGFDEHRVRALTWTELDGARVVRDGDAWRWEQGGARGDADPATVAAVLAALRGATWQRTGPLPATHGTLRLDPGPTIGFGPPLAGTEQTWLAIDGRGVLVESWVARALDPGGPALRDRFPFAHAAAAEHLAVGRADLHGHPRREAGNVLVDAAKVRRLEAALAAVEFVGAAGAPARFHGGKDIIVLDDLRAEIGDECPADKELTVLSTPSGSGCIRSEISEELDDAACAFDPQQTDRIEPRLVPLPPTGARFASGETLDFVHRTNSDPARVDALLAALAAPTDLVPPRTDCQPWLIVDGPAGSIALSLCGDHTIRRDADPAAYQPTAAAFAAIARGPADYRDRTLWLEDPSTITAITVDGHTFVRGASLGDWSSGDPAALEAAAIALAQVVPIDRTSASPSGDAARPGEAGPLRRTEPAFAPNRRISITVRPPAGPQRNHALVLDDAHCTTATEQLPAALCAAIRALH